MSRTKGTEFSRCETFFTNKPNEREQNYREEDKTLRGLNSNVVNPTELFARLIGGLGVWRALAALVETGRDAHFLAEDAAKVVAIRETHCQGHFGDGLFALFQQGPGALYAVTIEVRHRGQAQLLMEAAIQMTLADAQPPR